MNKLTASPTFPTPGQGPLGAPQPQGMPPGGAAQPAPPTRDQIVEAIEKVHYLNDGLRLLLNKEGGASRSDVIDEAGHLIAEGILSPQQAAQELQSLPDDNGQIKAWLQNHIVNSTITRGKLLEMLSSGGEPAQADPAQDMPPNALTMMGSA